MLTQLSSVSQENWRDWKWQQKNSITAKNFTSFFPNLNTQEIESLQKYDKQFKFSFTPYLLNLIDLDENGNPCPNDPIWMQIRYSEMEATDGYSDYDGKTINWEIPSEFPSEIMQYKYPDRAIIRLTNSCLGYCNYCYLAMRTLDKKIQKHQETMEKNWDATLSFLRSNPQIRDLLISGGDPLLLSNSRLRQIFSDLRSIKSIKTLRLNTRALTHNPFRFDTELISLFQEYRINVLEVHFAHPREITADVDYVLDQLDKINSRPLLLWRSPLLKDINNVPDVMEDLLVKLYERTIVPYYVFHYAPFAPGRHSLSTSVREGIQLLLKIRRKIPGPAFPIYCLYHPTGKQDIPLEPEGTPRFKYVLNEQGKPIIEYRNWKGEWVSYDDPDPTRPITRNP